MRPFKQQFFVTCILGSATLLAAACGAGANASNQQPQRDTMVDTGSGERVIGSGRVIRENRSVGAIRRMSVGNSADIFIRQGSNASLTIEAEDNIVGLISTTEEGGTLRVSSNGNYTTQEGIRLYLTVPELDSIVLTGSGDVKVEDWIADRLDLRLEGSGDIIVVGDVGQIVARVMGAGDIGLEGANAEHIDAAISGSGDIRAGSPRQLAASVSGSGEVHYSGNPQMLEQQVTGSGRITRQ